MIGGSAVPQHDDGVEVLRGRFEASGQVLPRIALFLFEAQVTTVWGYLPVSRQIPALLDRIFLIGRGDPANRTYPLTEEQGLDVSVEAALKD